MYVMPMKHFICVKLRKITLSKIYINFHFIIFCEQLLQIYNHYYNDYEESNLEIIDLNLLFKDVGNGKWAQPSLAPCVV